jgi:hypothetical protein
VPTINLFDFSRRHCFAHIHTCTFTLMQVYIHIITLFGRNNGDKTKLTYVPRYVCRYNVQIKIIKFQYWANRYRLHMYVHTWVCIVCELSETLALAKNPRRSSSKTSFRSWLKSWKIWRENRSRRWTWDRFDKISIRPKNFSDKFSSSICGQISPPPKIIYIYKFCWELWTIILESKVF